MENSNRTAYVTLLLSGIAGYCDTVTFVGAHAVFSAHVTGNFILFAYQLIRASDPHAWIKLLTFPVFIIAVAVGGRVATGTEKKQRILLVEGALLLLASILAVFFCSDKESEWATYIIVMIVVFAMGMQNAFGKLYSKATYGPTTMMTGNVTQAALDIGTLIRSRFKDETVKAGFGKNLLGITGFLCGCVAGAILTQIWGLHVLALPALVLVVCFFLDKDPKTEPGA